ncbi:MBL fold metallo-hydrolase [Paenibacillus macerans]|uniref:Metallo-beta-lactamase superfamily protein n=4 Tax=Paenibacillus TaxID=44249 RepID=A0A090ZEK8_PAEMA|nr:MBL fold metallo-hydrolase [Paenibacillus macerans]KFN08640.1 metallo-beta-lactamase superfamily protein [Paenibacillus macerans]MCY7559036.1 MBL fold metallo-hydrolase [Paenibacillus macerans]MEC0152722.1 MBL fold metallo-hydrolase [Paenibacillus macerans]MEC0328795.1 MBL fold metallo-hydrolase [Paenibacillus macerans]UMV47971.1 MBL fold metallo-hydrolase [Paenibacillus macerans]
MTDSIRKDAGLTRQGAALINEVIRTEVPYGTLALWFLGQESVIIKGDGITLYVDPYVSGDLDSGDWRRTFPAPIEPGDILGADLCLITHEHDDHMDGGTLPYFHRQNPAAPIVAPACCKPALQEMGIAAPQIWEADDRRQLELFSKLRLTVIPAAHEQLERDEEGKPRYVGYVIELNGVTLYHAGDTLVYPELIERLRAVRPDVALLPINGRDYFRGQRGIVGNMNYREAAELAAAIDADTVIPLHYDLFAVNAEKPGHFVDDLYERFPEQKCHVMARGERFVYVSPRAFLR